MKRVQGGLVFLKEDVGSHIPRGDCIHELEITRADLPAFWHRYIYKVNALRIAHQTGNWPAVPSGLCRNHCNVVACLHNGHYS